MIPILDACCGSRMFYFNKNNLVYFNDIRDYSDTLYDDRKLGNYPDTRWDFRSFPILDNSYHMVVLDLPHLIKVRESSWLAKKYGKLPIYDGRCAYCGKKISYVEMHIEHIPSALKRDSSSYRIAKRFGLIRKNKDKVRFYFEEDENG
ncbi:MAG: hypothetical protein HFF02_01925 [Erysipelotrichaceae bacterium]|nr:hypothetical protein [Erysipelotrichaceae bacterium]